MKGKDKGVQSVGERVVKKDYKSTLSKHKKPSCLTFAGNEKLLQLLRKCERTEASGRSKRKILGLR